ncbi:MAG: FAD-dependent oxidoreductase [Patescibacteria group bacterium]
MLNCTYIVIGAGQTGLKIAYELANLDQKVILVEQAEFGGTYLLSRDVPKYFLTEIAKEFSSSLRLFKENQETFSTLISYRRTVGKIINSKIVEYREGLLSKIINHPNIKVLKGVAEFTSKSLVEINSNSERHLVTFNQAIIATGKNTLTTPNIKGIEHIDFLHQHNVYLFEEVPSHLGIIGLSIENLEIANIYANLGVKVSIFEEKDSASALRNLDRSAFNYAIKQLLAKQVEFYFQTKISSISKKNDSILIQSTVKKFFEVSHVYTFVKETFTDDELSLKTVGLNWTSKGVLTSPSGLTQQRNIWALGEANNRITFNNKYSQIYDLVEKVRQTMNNDSKFLLNTTLIPLQLSGNGVDPIKAKINKIALDRPAVTIGMTEHAAITKYGRDTEIEVIDSGIIEGFAKMVLKSGSRQLVGVSLTGSFCTILEAYTINSFQNQESYLSYRNFIKTLLGV